MLKDTCMCFILVLLGHNTTINVMPKEWGRYAIYQQLTFNFKWPKYLVYAYAWTTGTFLPLFCVTTVGYGPSTFSTSGWRPLYKNVFVWPPITASISGQLMPICWSTSYPEWPRAIRIFTPRFLSAVASTLSKCIGYGILMELLSLFDIDTDERR